MTKMAKKGITAVVAIVLLLMMTVAAAGLAYMWVVGMQKDVQSGTSAQVQSQQAQTQSSLAIDSMWSNNQTNSSNGNISFALRNSGTFAFDDLTDFSVYVDGVKLSSTPWLNGTLAPADVKTIYTNISYPKVGVPRTVKLVSPTGVEVIKRCSSMTITQPNC